MMIRQHLNPPNQNDEQILEKTSKIFAKVDIFQFVASAERWPSISALNRLHATSRKVVLALLEFYFNWQFLAQNVTFL